MKTTPQPLTQVIVSVPRPAEDATQELLARVFQTTASSYFSERTQKSSVAVYLESIPQQTLNKKLESIRTELKTFRELGLTSRTPVLRVKVLAAQDWAESWKNHFKPFVAGGMFLVKPSWIQRKPSRGVHEIILDPGLSFGTGHHATTRFCLEQIASLARRGQRLSLLDLGTGSGILAIGAAKAGLGPIRAVDNDPVAVEVAKANAEVNGVGSQIHFAKSDVSRLLLAPAKTYGVVCANILAVVLEEYAAQIAAQVAPGGTLLAAGILTAQFAAVQRAFERHHLRLSSTVTRKEWTSGVFQKTSSR